MDLIRQLLNEGEKFEQQGCGEKALEKFNEAVKVDPECVYSLFRRGLFFENTFNTELACNDYFKIVEIAGAENAKYLDALFHIGNICASRGAARVAIRYYNMIVEKDPNYMEVYVTRGIILNKIGQKDAAMKDFDQILDWKPDTAKGFMLKGGVLMQLGKLKEALEFYNKSLELVPGDKNVLFGRNLILSKLKTKD